MHHIHRFFRLSLAAALLLTVPALRAEESNIRPLKWGKLHTVGGIFNTSKLYKPLSLRSLDTNKLRIPLSSRLLSTNLRGKLYANGIGRFSGPLANGLGRSRMGLLALGAVTAPVAVSASGCGGGGGGGSTSCDVIYDLFNDTRLETLDIYVDGFYVTSIYPGTGYNSSTSLCLSAGWHTLDIYEGFSGELIYTETNYYSRNSFWSKSIWDPWEAELNVENLTQGSLDLYVSNTNNTGSLLYYDTIPWGSTYAYPVREGLHRIKINDAESLSVLYDQVDNFIAGNAYLYSIASCVDVEIVNNSYYNNLWVIIDGNLYIQGPNTSYFYTIDSGWHNITVQAWHGTYDQSGTYTCGYWGPYYY